MKRDKLSIPVDRLSIISALIILNYALMPFIISPQIPINFSVFGFLVDIHVEYADLMVLSAALFAAIGSYWLLYDHPMMKKKQIYIHLILPTLTAGVMSIPLKVITIGLAWWIVFALGCVLIIFTLIAEYYSIYTDTSLSELSRIIIIPLAVSLFLLLSISTRSSGFRLYIQILLLGFSFAIIYTRLIALTTSEEKKSKTLVSTLLFIQALTACHYLPLTSVSFGLVMSGFASLLISIPLVADNKTALLPTLRNAVLYALPFFIGAIFFL